MNKICGLFVILAVLGDLAFCKTLYYPLPYKNQNENNVGRLFNNFFTSVENKNEAKNNTSTTSALTPTPKPQLTTENLWYYPIYQEPIYDPNYYQIIPPYNLFYNSPLDSSELQYDSFGPYYPIVNNIPSIYTNEIPPIPYLKPSLINLNTIPEASNPNQITKVNPTPVPISFPQRIENINDVEIKHRVQEALANEVNKLLSDFYTKHLYGTNTIQVHENSEISAKNDTDDRRDEFKDLLSTAEPIDSVTNYTLIAENSVLALEKEVTKKLNNQSVHNVETGKQLLSNESKITKPTKISINVNPMGTATTSQNDTDDSRKLNIDIKNEFGVNVPVDESQPVSATLGNNQTSVDFKINNSTTEDSVKFRRFFINSEGNECMEEAVMHNGQPYKLFTCSEKSISGKDVLVRKTTRKSDVTYYTEELSTIVPTTTESTLQHLKSDEVATR